MTKKERIIIQIDADYGSDHQAKVLIEIIRMVIKALEINWKFNHKKNKISHTVTFWPRV